MRRSINIVLIRFLVGYRSREDYGRRREYGTAERSIHKLVGAGAGRASFGKASKRSSLIILRFSSSHPQKRSCSILVSIASGSWANLRPISFMPLLRDAEISLSSLTIPSLRWLMLFFGLGI